jgi:hypothetical protein
VHANCHILCSPVNFYKTTSKDNITWHVIDETRAALQTYSVAFDNFPKKHHTIPQKEILMNTNELSSIPAEIATQYVSIWNENDPARRRALVERTFMPHVSYIDPLMQSAGHNDLDAMIGAAQVQFPGLRFRVLGKPDGHHDVVRFSWSLGAGDAEPLACGTDFAVLASDGRIERITGFLDKMPG